MPCPGCQACWCLPRPRRPVWWQSRPSPPRAGSGCFHAHHFPLQTLRDPLPYQWRRSHLRQHTQTSEQGFRPEHRYVLRPHSVEHEIYTLGQTRSGKQLAQDHDQAIAIKQVAHSYLTSESGPDNQQIIYLIHMHGVRGGGETSAESSQVQFNCQAAVQNCRDVFQPLALCQGGEKRELTNEDDGWRLGTGLGK